MAIAMKSQVIPTQDKGTIKGDIVFPCLIFIMLSISDVAYELIFTSSLFVCSNLCILSAGKVKFKYDTYFILIFVYSQT